jgi:hypothetical protein
MSARAYARGRTVLLALRGDGVDRVADQQREGEEDLRSGNDHVFLPLD